MDRTGPIEAQDTDLLSAAAVSRLREHPRFRAAVEAFAAGALAQYEREDTATHWLHRDLGRSSLYLGAILLDRMPAGLTFAGLAEMAVHRDVCSRGRVLAFVQYALATGRMVVAVEPGPWSRRRLSLTPAFLAPMRERFIASLNATSIVAPEVAETLPRLASDEAVRQVATAMGTLLAVRPELNRNPGGALRQVFIARD
ncbi:MAG: hypothetical protein JSR98_18780, partial [Proteobacteria bacterium]|nr:hypothetical protein [Pseudomonadota bacterium]